MDARPDAATPQIFKLRDQAEEQETTLKAQEEEVNSKKRELEVLVEEEAKLGADIKKSQREIENLMKGLSDVEELLAEVGDQMGTVENLQLMGVITCIYTGFSPTCYVFPSQGQGQNPGLGMLLLGSTKASQCFLAQLREG